MNKKIITIIIALAAVCGCQKTEKTIYKVPLSEHAMELERQEKAYNDSLEKYSALLDTAQIQYYFDLHKAVLDTLNIVLRQEVDAFMAAKDREAANEEKILRLHETKRNLADAMLEGTSQSHKLSSEELLQMLGA